MHPQAEQVSIFKDIFLLSGEDLELQLVVLDRILKATTKKDRQLFEEKSAPQTKSCRLCLWLHNISMHEIQTVVSVWPCPETRTSLLAEEEDDEKQQHRQNSARSSERNCSPVIKYT